MRAVASLVRGGSAALSGAECTETAEVAVGEGGGRGLLSLQYLQMIASNDLQDFCPGLS